MTYIKLYINNVADLIEQISYIHDDIDFCQNKHLYLRGQNYIDNNLPYGKVSPGVCRNGFMLKNESKMMQEAIRRNFHDLRQYQTPFERLTVLQHYGLTTRLLDVTTNPLVALYFACKDDKRKASKCNDDNCMYNDKSDGVVYCKLDKGEYESNKKVMILASFAEFIDDSKYPIFLDDFLKYLMDNKIISDDDAYKYKDKDYNELNMILNENYFVTPPVTNNRLLLQSGAFLLAGGVNINKYEENNYTVDKIEVNLAEVFDNNIFIVPYASKKNILSELDVYNINESSLFPEMEHQMEYIKSKYNDWNIT